jgi:hypothetical protein
MFIILANSMCLSIKTHGPTRGIANTNFNTVKRETNDESRGQNKMPGGSHVFITAGVPQFQETRDT